MRKRVANMERWCGRRGNSVAHRSWVRGWGRCRVSFKGAVWRLR